MTQGTLGNLPHDSPCRKLPKGSLPMMSCVSCPELSYILLADLFQEDVLSDLPMVHMSVHMTTFLEAAHGQGIPGGFLRPVLNHTQLGGHGGLPELRWHRQIRKPPIL